MVTFTFSGRAFEGLVVNREINRLGEQYNAVGTLMPMEEWQWDATYGRDFLENSPLVRYTETLRVIPGVMDGVYTPDFDRRSPFPNRMFVYGNLVRKYAVEMVFDEAWFSFFPYMQVYYFDILVDTVAAGLPEYVLVGDTIRFFLVDYDGRKSHIYQDAQIGERYFVGGQYGKNLRLIRHAFRNFPGQFSPESIPYHLPFPRGSHLRLTSDVFDLILQPLTSAGVYLYPVSDEGVVETPEILEQVDVLRENIHRVFLRPSRDMSARLDVKSSMFLLDGRFLDSYDYINENPVAVIRAEFAAKRDLQVGDTLTITMREQAFAGEYIMPDTARWFPTPEVGELMTWEDFLDRFDGDITLAIDHTLTHMRFYEVHYPGNRPFFRGVAYNEDFISFGQMISVGGGPFIDGIVYDGIFFFDVRGVDEIINLEMATGYITDGDYNWRNRESKTKTFEIVGIYGTTDNLTNFVTLSHNNVFVPDSLVPANWTQDVLYRNLSFVLYCPGDEEAFTLRYQGVLEEMGFWPLFGETGWDSFVATVSPIQNGILIGLLAFGILVLIVFYLVVFLYFAGSVKEFAILRALGVKKRTALLGSLLPMFLIAMIGVFAGAIPAWQFAIRQGEVTLGQIEGAIFTNPPVYWMFQVVALLFLLIMIICGVQGRMLTRCSELELLQGNMTGRKKVKKVRSKELRSEKVKSENLFKETNIFNQKSTTNLTNITGLEEIRLTNKTKDDKDLGRSAHNIAYMVRMIGLSILRKGIKSCLAIAVAMGFVLVLSWIPVSIDAHQRQVDWLYSNTIVTGTMVVDPASGASRGRSISFNLLRDITALTPITGMDWDDYNYDGKKCCCFLRGVNTFIRSYHGEAQEAMAVGLLGLDGLPKELTEDSLFWAELLGVSSLEPFTEFHGVSIDVEYMDSFGFDPASFWGNISQLSVEYNQLGILICSDFKEELGVGLGDRIFLGPAARFVLPRERDIEIYQVVGTFERAGGVPKLITPLGNMQYHLGNRMAYNRAEFQLNPVLNRELGLFRDLMDDMLDNTDPRLILILRDHILRGVVEPLEQKIVMMETLYPIIQALAGVIALGLTMLLLLPSMKIAAIMRATGMKHWQVMVILSGEQRILCVMGLTLGAGISLIAFGWVNLLGVALYLIGCVLAGMIVSIVIKRRKPMEMLQVKE
jgi:hypothetical protein